MSCAVGNISCIERCFTDRPSHMVITELAAPKAGNTLGFSLHVRSNQSAGAAVRKGLVAVGKGLSLLYCRKRTRIVTSKNGIRRVNGHLGMAKTGIIAVLLANSAGFRLSSSSCAGNGTSSMREQISTHVDQTSGGACGGLLGARLSSCVPLFTKIRLSFSRRLPSCPASGLVHRRGSGTCLSVLCFRCKECLALDSSHNKRLPDGLRKL